MSHLGETFLSGVGPANPSQPYAFKFEKMTDQMWLDLIAAEINAGWYQNRFLFLFGEGLNALNKCLDEWDFIFTEPKDRKVIGRNAYGALLIVENANDNGYISSIGVLNPLNVSYFTNEHLIFSNLLGSWLPGKRLPDFHDTRLYDAFHKTTGQYMTNDEMLAIKKPLTLGGTMSADNFQIENILDYYKTTGKIYREVMSKAKIV